MDRLKAWRSALEPILAVALLVNAAAAGFHDFTHFYGVDYYHYWGIPIARDALGSDPYASTSEYARFLNQMSDASTDIDLRWANHFRRAIEPTGTPLFYAACSLLPGSFGAGYAGIIAILFAAMGASVFAMGRAAGIGAWRSLALAAVVAVTFAPFNEDVRVGNVSSLQLAFLVALAFSRSRLDAVYLPALAFAVVLKPNIAVAAAALALHFIATRDRKATLTGIAWSAAVVLLGYVVGSAYFPGANAWSDWSAYLHGANGGTILYGTDVGNVSPAVLLSKRLGGMGPAGYAVASAVALAAILAASLASFGREPGLPAERIRGCLEDPWCMASLGVLFMFATSPLIWPHYFMLSLIPMLWSWRGAQRWDAARGLVVIGYLLMVLPLSLGAAAQAQNSLLFTLGWFPVAGAVCARLAQSQSNTNRSRRT
jgi:hypothetical protein